MSTISTNRLLGYPDDARLLIVNADDFGMCHAVNAAILQAWRDGLVASTSLMVPAPWAPHAMQLLRHHPDLPFGVHLTLVRDFEPYRWGPVAARNEVPSLIDETGNFHIFARRAELLKSARIEEVETEFRAQIDTVLAAGLHPDHLDWHALADGGREDIFALTRALAREYGLALRVHDRAHAETCRSRGLPVPDHDVLDSYHIDPEEKPARFADLLRGLPPGLTEWALHPSLGNDEARALEPENWRVRRADLDFALSPNGRTVIEAEGIVLLDYRAPRAVWHDRQT